MQIQVSARHSTSVEVVRRVMADEPLTDGDALAIASWYQAPRGTGETLASFASGCAVDDADLLNDIAATLEQPFEDDADRDELYHLVAWVRRYTETA